MRREWTAWALRKWLSHRCVIFYVVSPLLSQIALLAPMFTKCNDHSRIKKRLQRKTSTCSLRTTDRPTRHWRLRRDSGAGRRVLSASRILCLVLVELLAHAISGKEFTTPKKGVFFAAIERAGLTPPCLGQDKAFFLNTSPFGNSQKTHLVGYSELGQDLSVSRSG